MSLGSFMENTFEHNTYHNHSHILSALRNAINTMRENDMLQNYRQVELADIQGLYDALVEHKDTYTATLKNKANISFNCIPCSEKPKSKFDLLAQNFGGDKHLIYCAGKAEHFALIAQGFNSCKHYLSLFLDRYYMFIHKTTFFEGLDFIDTWDTQKKQVFLGVWFAIVWRDKNKDFVSLWEEFIKELDRLAFVPERKVRKVVKSRQKVIQKEVMENYQSWEFLYTRRRSRWSSPRFESVYGWVTRQRKAMREEIITEYYEEDEYYYNTYDAREKLSDRLNAEHLSSNTLLAEKLSKEYTVVDKGANIDKIAKELEAKRQADFEAYNELRENKKPEYKKMYPVNHYGENEWETQWLKAYPTYDNALEYANRYLPKENSITPQGENNANN